MKRTKPYYSKKQIINLISSGNAYIEEEARRSAQDDFGWGIDDICNALKALPVKYWYDSKKRFDNPEIWVDYYRAHDLMGERVYTHFYVNDGKLIIDSFKEI